MNETETTISTVRIESLIHNVRGKKVILDSSLANLYGVPTKRFNEQIKRNIERFPDDFMFVLTEPEFTNLRSQFATSSSHGGRRYLPKVLTEHGADYQGSRMPHSFKQTVTKLSITVVCFFSLLTCSNPVENDKIEYFKYPLNIGNVWKYRDQCVTLNCRLYNEDSVLVPKDTNYFSYVTNHTITVIGIDTVYGIPFFVLLDSCSENNSVVKRLYVNKEDGLYMVYKSAYAKSINELMPGTSYLSYKGKSYFPIDHFLPEFHITEIALNKSYPCDSLLSHVYKYPYKKDDCWYYFREARDFTSNRKYHSKENSTVTAGSFDCYKIELIIGDNDIWGKEDGVYEWVSPQKGLVKREQLLTMEVTGVNDMGYPLKLGELDLQVTYELIDFNIQME